RSQILTMGPLGTATVVVGCEEVALVLVVSESESPHPATTRAMTQAIRAGSELTAFTYPRSLLSRCPGGGSGGGRDRSRSRSRPRSEAPPRVGRWPRRR